MVGKEKKKFRHKQRYHPASRGDNNNNNAAAAAGQQQQPHPQMPDELNAAAEDVHFADDDFETEHDSRTFLEQLDDTCAETRLRAMESLAHAFGSGHTTAKTLGNQAVFTKLLRHMQDDNYGVRVAATGAIRNASIAIGYHACEILMHLNVMPVLLTNMTEAAALLKAKVAGGQDVKDEVDMLTQLLGLLWDICEENSQGLAFFNAHGLMLMESILACMTVSVIQAYPTLSENAAQCLHVLTEDNPPAIAAVLGLPGSTELLVTLAQSEQLGILHRMLATGILYNMRSSLGLDSIFPALQSALGACLLPNLPSMLLQQLAALLQLEEDEVDTENPEISAFLQAANGQLLGLQILTNACVCDGHDGDGDDDEEWEDADEEDIAGGGNNVVIGDDAGEQTQGNEQITAWMIQGVLQSVLAKCESCGPEVTTAAATRLAVKELKFYIDQIQCAAIDCVSNWVDVVPIATPEQQQHVIPAIAAITQSVVNAASYISHTDPECTGLVIDSVLRSLAALIRKQKQISAATINFDRGLFTWAQSCTRKGSSETRRNAIALLGCMGTCSCFQDEKSGMEMGIVLLQCLRDEDVLVVGDVLNAFFDVFGQDEMIPLCHKLNLGERLKSFVPNYKQMVVAAKKKLDKGDMAKLVDIRTNLSRFVSYLATLPASS